MKKSWPRDSESLDLEYPISEGQSYDLNPGLPNFKDHVLYLCFSNRIENWYFNLCFVQAEESSLVNEWQPWTAKKSMDKICFHCIFYTNYFNHKIWQLVNNGLRNPERREAKLI